MDEGGVTPSRQSKTHAPPVRNPQLLPPNSVLTALQQPLTIRYCAGRPPSSGFPPEAEGALSWLG